MEFIRPQNATSKNRSKTQSKGQSLGPVKTMIVLNIVMDVTASTQPYIDGIRAGLYRILDEFETNAYRALVGLVLFRDELYKEMPSLYSVGTEPKKLRKILAAERAHGGGDIPESSLPAIMKSLDLPGAPESSQTVMLHITDAGCHDPEQGHTANSVLAALEERGVLYFGCTPRIEPYISFANATNGDIFEIHPGMNADAFVKILDQFAKKTIHTLRYSAKADEDMPDIVRKTRLHFE